MVDDITEVAPGWLNGIRDISLFPANNHVKSLTFQETVKNARNYNQK